MVRFSGPPLYSITKGKIRFPRTSQKVRESVKGNYVVFVNRGASGKDWKPVHEFVNAWASAKYLKEEMGAEKVCVIMPNMPFAKQDKYFYDEEGNRVEEAITVKYIRSVLKNFSNADLLISVTPHDFRKTGWIVKDENPEMGWKRNEKNQIVDSEGRVILPEPENWTGFAYAIDVTPKLVEYVFKELENPYVVGADKSVKNVIKEIKEKYANIDGTFSEKFRNKYFNEMLEVEIKDLPKSLKGLDVVLIDDVIITAGTMYKQIQEIKKRNPKSITCAAVHGEFSYNQQGISGLDVLRNEGANVIVTNTIETPVSVVDVTPEVAKELYELFK